MIVNAPQRDDVNGTSASASAELYRERRQGNLNRYSDGFRTTTPSVDPRRRAEGGHTPDPGMAPYRPNPRPPETNDKRNTPRTWAYFRPASPGAPRVNFPDAKRTAGHLQPSGEAWGRFGEPSRAVLTPARNGSDAPPSHRLGAFTPGTASAYGSRWRRPERPHIYDRLPG